ncbi:hypothetical protein BDZ91DRAFT_715557 [Kalaharituber pfeilii]|nr:hypothetical protein BDZ91DRAFT_715557 [Kalaharituber pfeilii]
MVPSHAASAPSSTKSARVDGVWKESRKTDARSKYFAPFGGEDSRRGAGDSEDAQLSDGNSECLSGCSSPLAHNQDAASTKKRTRGDECSDAENERAKLNRRRDALHEGSTKVKRAKQILKAKNAREMQLANRITLPSGETLIPNRLSTLEYKEETIQENTMAFLNELAANNNRPWFAENESFYRAARQDFESFVDALSQRITKDVDTTVPELPLKDIIFRIHRDIRFSNDQTPYKIYFSAAWSRTGRKGPYAHYYLQIQPNGKSFAGGGIWHADTQPLSLLRRDISRRPHRLKSILARDSISRGLLGLKGRVDKQKAVQAFASRNAADALKTAPKGYPRDHPELELLRLRSFTVGLPLTDEAVKSNDFLEHIVDIFTKVEPLITYLNSVVMPDIYMDSSVRGSDNTV